MQRGRFDVDIGVDFDVRAAAGSSQVSQFKTIVQ